MNYSLQSLKLTASADLPKYCTNDLFSSVEETKIYNYADDMTIYECGHDLEHIISGLETDGQSSPNGLLITA